MMALPASLGFTARPAGGGGGGGGTVSHVASTGALYVASGTTINTPSTPAGVAAGDGLFAVVYARSALTPPAGWTLVDSQAVTGSGFTQTQYIYRRDSAASGDSSTAFTWTQASSGRMGLAYVLARSSTASLSVAQAGKRADTVAVGPANTWLVPCPTLTAAVDGELLVTAASAIVLAVSTNSTWAAPSGGTLRTTAVLDQNRLAAVTQGRNTGQANASPFTLAFTGSGDNYTTAITLRLQAV